MPQNQGEEESNSSTSFFGALYDLRDHVGAWCGALAMLVVAVVLWIAPGEMAGEFEYHKEAAIAAGSFGISVLLALVLKGRAGYRAKALVMGFLSLAVGTFSLWWVQDAAQDVWALHETGEVRTVEVVGTTSQYNPKSRKTTRKTRVIVDGKRVTVKLSHLPRRGATVQVLVAPDRPQAIVPGSTVKEWLPLLDVVCGQWAFLLFTLASVFCIFALPINLWHVVFGPPKDHPLRS